MGYIAFNLTPSSREELLRQFPPKFEKVVAHHITHQFGVLPGTALPAKPKTLYVIGRSSNDDIECLVVEVDSSIKRPDGGTYHITLSHKLGVAPKMSNDLLKEKSWDHLEAVTIQAEPTFNK